MKNLTTMTFALIFGSLSAYAGGGTTYIPTCDASYSSDVYEHLNSKSEDYNCDAKETTADGNRVLVECLHNSGTHKVKNLKVKPSVLADKIVKYISGSESDVKKKENYNKAIQLAILDSYYPDDCLSHSELAKKDQESIDNKIEFMQFNPQDLALINTEKVGSLEIKEVIDGKRIYTGKNLETGETVTVVIEKASQQ